MVAYFQHAIASWMDGTEGLEDGEYRAYHVVCQLIYLNNGPIVLHESGIAGRCNQHPLAFRRNVEKLIERGKIVRSNDGKITNRRVEAELVKIVARRRKNPETPRAPPAHPPGVGRGSGGGSAAKPLKTKEATPSGEALESKNKKTPGANAPGAGDLERELFRRGKEVLGVNAGGMITQLLKAKGYDVTAAMQAIEDASTKHSPREYVGAAIKRGGTVKNGAAAAALSAWREVTEQQQEGFDYGQRDDAGEPGGEVIPPGSTRGDQARVVRARGR